MNNKPITQRPARKQTHRKTLYFIAPLQSACTFVYPKTDSPERIQAMFHSDWRQITRRQYKAWRYGNKPVTSYTPAESYGQVPF